MQKLHFFGSREAQNTDTGFQNVLCQTDEGDVAGLQFSVFLGEDTGLVIELVDAAGQLVDVGADHVGGFGLQGGFQTGTELGDGQHQILGLGVGGSLDGQVLPCAVAGQDGLDTDDGVENVRTGVALKSGEALQIEVIVLGGLVGKITVFQGSQSGI